MKKTTWFKPLTLPIRKLKHRKWQNLKVRNVKLETEVKFSNYGIFLHYKADPKTDF